MMAQTVVVVLDIDGTLLDSSDLHQRAAMHAMAPLSLDLKSKPLEAFRNFTDLGVFDELLTDARGHGSETGEFLAFEEALSQHFNTLAAEGLKEIDGAAALLEALFAHEDIQPVFATGSCRSAAATKLRHFGLELSNIVIQTGSDYHRREDIVAASLSEAARLRGVNDVIAVSIGDGLWDEVTAERLGIPFIGIGGDPARFRLKATHTLPDFNGLSADDIIAVARPYRRNETIDVTAP